MLYFYAVDKRFKLLPIRTGNVGKSSLLNALMGSNLAQVSKTPGRTRGINYYNIDEQFFVIDLPGYGNAELPNSLVS